MLKLRPFQPSDADYVAVVTISNANWSDSPKTIAEEKYADVNRNPTYFFKRLIGELSGGIIAIGECGETFWLEVRSYRRQGIATALKVHAITIAKTQG